MLHLWKGVLNFITLEMQIFFSFKHSIGIMISVHGISPLLNDKAWLFNHHVHSLWVTTWFFGSRSIQLPPQFLFIKLTFIPDMGWSVRLPSDLICDGAMAGSGAQRRIVCLCRTSTDWGYSWHIVFCELISLSKLRSSLSTVSPRWCRDWVCVF